MFFYKHMKFWKQARLYLAISDFKPQIMLSIIMLRLSRSMFNCHVTTDHESVLQ